MTKEEEATIFLQTLKCCLYKDTSEKNFDLAFEALDKQTPKKPICFNIDETYKLWRCKSCNFILGMGIMYLSINYCPECGQKLDWSK